MSAFKIFFLIFIILYTLLLLFFSLRTKRFLFSILLNALSGVILMTVINLLRKYLGFNIPINEFTAITSAAFGIPGVSALLLINIIFL